MSQQGSLILTIEVKEACNGNGQIVIEQGEGGKEGSLCRLSSLKYGFGLYGLVAGGANRDKVHGASQQFRKLLHVCPGLSGKVLVFAYV